MASKQDTLTQKRVADVVFRVRHDPMIADPWEDDAQVTRILTWMRNRSFGETHNFATPSEFIAELDPGDVVRPLYAYIHSGVALSTTPFRDPWDSGQAGVVVVPQDRLDYLGIRDRTPETIDEIIQVEVEQMQQRINGAVYAVDAHQIVGDVALEEPFAAIGDIWGFKEDDLDEAVIEMLLADDQFETLGVSTEGVQAAGWVT